MGRCQCQDAALARKTASGSACALTVKDHGTSLFLPLLDHDLASKTRTYIFKLLKGRRERMMERSNQARWGAQPSYQPMLTCVCISHKRQTNHKILSTSITDFASCKTPKLIGFLPCRNPAIAHELELQPRPKGASQWTSLDSLNNKKDAQQHKVARTQHKSSLKQL